MSFNDQYKYDAMANKVVQADKSLVHRGGQEPQSLAGKISLRDMGSAKSEIQPEKRPEVAKPARTEFNYGNNTLYATLLQQLVYYPTTQDAQLIFQLLTTWCVKYLPDSLNSDAIISVADDVLAIAKQKVSNHEKQRQCTELLGPVSDADFHELLSLCDRIVDYEKVVSERQSDETEMAIVFEDEEEEDPVDVEDVETGDAEAGDVETGDVEIGDVEALGENASHLVIGTSKVASNSPKTFAAPDYDLFYVSRKLSAFFPDAYRVQELSTKIMTMLGDLSLDDRLLENELMEVFDFENSLFPLVEDLILNRRRIVFAIKLSETDNKAAVFAEMRALDLDLLVEEFQNQPKRRKLESVPEKPAPETLTRKPKIVDLDALSFDQNHVTAKITLPEGSFKRSTKLYEEIHVPPPAKPERLESEQLVAILSMPEWCQSVFPASETSSLNRIQSQVYPTVFHTTENILLCAPTGAGKTNVAMLAALQTIDGFRNPQTNDIDPGFKIVYIAPLKALVAEQVREFKRRLGVAPYNLRVGELTGDSVMTKQQITDTQIIVTTPEKWDVITRKSNDTSYTNLVRLVIVDEIHLLHDERGPVLEAIIARIHRSAAPVRLIGLSATLPNYKDVATFMRVKPQGVFYFDASYRPCPLAQQFLGITEKKALKKLNAMNEATYDKVLEAAGKHQMIIFVHSRKDTHQTAKWIRDKLLAEDKLNLFLKSDLGSREILKQEAEGPKLKDTKLKDLLPTGFGIHHAGLTREERSTVEDLFAEGYINVLVSTATLAWGVNLPAHTVIIKGTEVYSPEKGGWTQLSPQDILQMLGRAGRPRYDTHGEGIIITTQDDIQYYLAVLNQQLPIESQMMRKLADSLNAEVVLGTVTCLEDAVEWLGSTYLYVRMLRSPERYRVGEEYKGDRDLVWKRQDLAHTALAMLAKNKLVVYEEEAGTATSTSGVRSVVPTDLGRIASHYYINHDSIHAYNLLLKPYLTEMELLRIFSSSVEFKFIPLRQEEKLEVTKLLERCPIPVKESSADPLAKVNVLLQAYISRLKLEGFALMADMIYITQSAGRILRALYEICLRKGWAALTKTVLNLCKMVEKRMWLTNSPLRQFPDCPTEIIKKMESSQMPWSHYMALTDAAEMSQAIRSEKQGRAALQLTRQYPKVAIEYSLQPVTPTLVRVLLAITPDWEWSSVHGNCESFLVFVEDGNGERVLYSDTLLVYRDYIGQEHVVEFTVALSEPLQPNYFASVISERWLNCEYKLPIILAKLKLPKKFPAFTELLDLQPTPVSDLHEEFALMDFEFFNKFQTQTFPALYNSAESVFIGAPKGSGKTVCAELAIFQHWKRNGGRIVYICPTQHKIDTLTKQWTKRFAAVAGGKEIAKLTGELAVDIKLVNASHLVLATPEQFDLVSRRWKQRKSVQAIELFVVDDAHMVGDGFRGPVYELIISRMRFISAQIENSLRIVALSTSLSNGRDFGEWIGCTKQNIFNFNSKDRFHPVEIRLQASSISHHPSLLLSLIKPTFETIQANNEENTLVFVPTRKLCVEVSVELLKLAEGSLLRCDELEIEPYLKRIQDSTLRESLSHGVGFLYQDMAPGDRILVEKLYAAGAVSVLLASREMCFTAPTAASVVVLTTQYYEGKEHRYIDYSINELLEMVGCSQGSAQGSLPGYVTIFSHTSKKDYYVKFLHEALPIESFMPLYLPDALVNEISTRIIQSRQDCIDWLTFTYFYRRLQMNPSFYDVKDSSHLGLSEHLSELIESVLAELVEANLVEVNAQEEEEEEEEITPLNGSMIAAYYNISFVTMQTFALSLSAKSKMKSIMEIVTAAAEFEMLPIRSHESDILHRIHNRLPVKHSSLREDSSKLIYQSSSVKAFILLQAHFLRMNLPPDLVSDQKFVLQRVLQLLYAAVDILSGEGFLNAMNAIDLCQMVVQAIWDTTQPLLQVPFFTDSVLAKCKTAEVETVYDIMALEDDERDSIMAGLTPREVNKVAEFVNAYPNIEVTCEMGEIISDEPCDVVVTLSKDEEEEEDDDDDVVVAPFYPSAKRAQWWVIIGDAATKQLYAIKKTNISGAVTKVKLQVSVPTAGKQELSVWAMCDSYIDADKEIALALDVQEAREEATEDEME
ncbi:hypothetical protein BABINDRAFT_167978 [Babjeviella inositovora NRRL Y-12698]|uniref:U5 small nuclear ribonucleoprotein 200 kDa helicase n=1 Tax=Babjeviella inositovora NRRL Y-12698 TaxID=984486 RepID=A0A1E3QM86_9ASCO|nr:uncharacterized protein BABINDRAFT_167978 [Babjeviella inositovora NRRL Y-12698]ODQ78795.1 hypothetical protein BABINDRAFT_167978 [Babjeviella inositovora NRRL Y-12698]